jgi:hypothetical protein
MTGYNYAPGSSAHDYESRGDLMPLRSPCVICGEAPAVEDDCCFVCCFNSFVDELSAAWLAGDVLEQRRWEGYITDLATKESA